MRYYDPEYGRERIKRRYVWAAWGFMLGALCGGVLAWQLIHALGL